MSVGKICKVNASLLTAQCGRHSNKQNRRQVMPRILFARVPDFLKDNQKPIRPVAKVAGLSPESAK
jgi:hypothetical protein